MRISIIPSANHVTVNGRNMVIDCSSLPTTIRAIHWFGEAGFVEYFPSEQGAFIGQKCAVGFGSEDDRRQAATAQVVT